MASLARRWRRLVKQHQGPIHRLFERMAGRACNVLMTAFEWKCRLVVIEERRSPFVAVVAGRAVITTRAELVCVRILMAFIAGLRGTGEFDVQHR